MMLDTILCNTLLHPNLPHQCMHGKVLYIVCVYHHYGVPSTIQSLLFRSKKSIHLIIMICQSCL